MSLQEFRDSHSEIHIGNGLALYPPVIMQLLRKPDIKQLAMVTDTNEQVKGTHIGIYFTFVRSKTSTSPAS